MTQNAPRPRALTPQQALAHAQQLFQQGQLPQAENICRRLVQAHPDFAPAWFQLGLIAVRAGRLPLAAQCMARAISAAPDAGPYHRALCEVFRRLGRFDGAAAAGKRAIELMPADTDAHYNYALALADGGNMAAAAEQYRAALLCDPLHGYSANNLGSALEKSGDKKGAEEAYKRAVDINPLHAEAQNNLGALCSEKGDLDTARARLSDAIKAKPDFVEAHFNLSTLKKYTDGDPHLAALEAVAKNARALPEEARMKFFFAIGKAYEDVGRYDDAFGAYEAGSRLKRATFQYDEARAAENIDRMIANYDRDFAAAPVAGCPDETPVFIVGMPRSGTSLIEQIIATHSRAYGAGELYDVGEAIKEETGQPPEGYYVDWLKAADDALVSKLGANYAARLRAHAAGAGSPHDDALRITDKMPGNFYYLGLIHKMLPKAKFIHAVRDPMDTCFSNFARLFSDTMYFTYDLGELGRYYSRYRRLMDHWKSVLPEGTILDVRYEDLVADQEAQSRRLVEFCGLDWEQGCLDFHKNARVVKTASIAQVREPMYKTSIARWQRFEKHLEPLRTAVEDGK